MHRCLHRVDIVDAFPGVDAAAEDMQVQQIFFRKPQDTKYFLPQIGLTAVRGQFQIFNTHHGDDSNHIKYNVSYHRKEAE